MKATQPRKMWSTTRKAILEGLPLKPSKKTERLYRLALQRAVQRMARDYAKELGRALQPLVITIDASLGAQLRAASNGLNHRWSKIFGKLAKGLVEKMIKGVDEQSKRSTTASLREMADGLTIKAPKLNGPMEDAIKKAISDNVGLIKSIQAQHHEKIEKMLLESVGDRQVLTENIKDIVKKTYYIGETTEKRAELIAKDQVSKLTTVLNAERAKAAGMTKFKWRHSGSAVHPRKLHQEYDGQIFEYEDLPIIDERTGERGLPGYLINCGCFAVPIFDFGASGDN